MTRAAGFTPGPWKVDERERAVLIPYRGKGHFAHAYGGTLANARLIAAAPELLEAWQKYFDAEERLLELERNNDTTKRFDDALRDKQAAEEMARAAIAKAQGAGQ